MLEMIEKGATTQAHPDPLVFVHGAWHAAWCWDEHFLDYFAERGYACYAPSLRGHGGSPGAERLRWSRIQDYVTDLAEVTAALPGRPVLIGHSMGGFVVQHFLAQHSGAGAVLIAAIPPAGAVRVTARIARRHPLRFLEANAKLQLAPMVATPALVRQLFFSASMPDAEVNRYHRLMQDESYRAYLDMLVFDHVKTARVESVPMLVLGAEDDAIVSQPEVRATASAYGTEAQFFSAMTHDMMLESGWRAVADRIAVWLGDRGH